MCDPTSLFALQFQIDLPGAQANKYRRKINRKIRNARHVYVRRGAINGATMGRGAVEQRRKVLSSFIAPAWLIRHAFRRRSKIQLD